MKNRLFGIVGKALKNHCFSGRIVGFLTNKSMPVIFLTMEERKAFEKLPEAVRMGVKIEEEQKAFIDSDERREVRMRNLKLEHLGLRALQEQAQKKKFTAEEVGKIAENIDLSGLSQNDLVELAFAWGPDVFTQMIAAALPAVSSSDDLAEVANLAGIRHGLLLSLA